MSVNCFLFVSFWFLRDAFFTVPGIRMCCPGGSEGDSRSFFPGRRSSLEGCTAATSSQSCWKCYCRTVHLQREEKDRIIVSSTSDILKSPCESETKNLCVSEGRSGSYSVLGGRSLRGWERSAADTWTSLCRQCEPAHKHSGGPCRTDDGREEFTFTRVTIQVPEYFCI